MIPVHLKTTDKTPGSPAETHYIVARNGLFVCKRTGWVDAVVPVEDIKVLEFETARANLLLPELPVDILGQALKFGKAVYDRCRSESCLLLHYNAEKGYRLTAPKQSVEPLSISYDASGRLKGFACVGTIHSHAALHQKSITRKCLFHQA